MPEPDIKITSRKLLLRLESKGIIREPPLEDRPTLPSKRRWGTARGYHYVDLGNTPPTFSFEGVTYFTKQDTGSRTLLWRKA